MDLVVDASSLIAELSRVRGRRPINHRRLALSISDHAWSEVWHELPLCLAARVRHQQITSEGAQVLHAECLVLVAQRIVVIYPEPFYASSETVARRRVPRDPNDWPTVALALECGSWTADADFPGCGVPTWTTKIVGLHLEA